MIRAAFSRYDFYPFPLAQLFEDIAHFISQYDQKRSNERERAARALFQTEYRI